MEWPNGNLNNGDLGRFVGASPFSVEGDPQKLTGVLSVTIPLWIKRFSEEFVKGKNSNLLYMRQREHSKLNYVLNLSNIRDDCDGHCKRCQHSAGCKSNVSIRDKHFRPQSHFEPSSASHQHQMMS